MVSCNSINNIDLHIQNIELRCLIEIQHDNFDINMKSDMTKNNSGVDNLDMKYLMSSSKDGKKRFGDKIEKT